MARKRHRVGKGRGHIVVRGGGHGAKTYTSGATALRDFWTLAEQGFPATLAIGGEYAATSGVSSREYPITWEAQQALNAAVGDIPTDKIHRAAVERARKARAAG
jgi:hypothetical protein